MTLDTRTIHGLDSLVAKLNAVSADMKLKGGRFALRKAAQVVVKAAKQNAAAIDDPNTGRSIAENIVERWNGKLYKSTGDIGFRVGVQGGAVVPKNNADGGRGGATPHWRFKEFGTERQAATPFMRPAMENNIDSVIAEFVSKYDTALDRALARAKK